MIHLIRFELQTQAYTRSLIQHFQCFTWLKRLGTYCRICFEDMIKWLILFCISSPLIWASSLGGQTGIQVSESLWIHHCNSQHFRGICTFAVLFVQCVLKSQRCNHISRIWIWAGLQKQWVLWMSQT